MSFYRDLALPQTLSDILRSRDAAVGHLREAYAAHERANAASSGITRFAVPHDSIPRLSLEHAVHQLDQSVWSAAFRLAGFHDLWDAQAADEFRRSIEKDTPAFSEANIRATFLDLLPQQEQMFRRGLVRIFRELSGHYRSNEDRFSVGRRMVVSYWAMPGYRGGLQVAHRAQDKVRDLLRVVAKLTDRTFDPGAALSAVHAAWAVGEYRDTYLRLVPFKNGNCHVYLLDEHLRERINGVIAEYYGDKVLAQRKAA